MRNRMGSELSMTPQLQNDQKELISREDVTAMLQQHIEATDRLAERRPSFIAAEKKLAERAALRLEQKKLIQGKERLLNVGQGRVVIKGRRIRCKMCR